MSLLGWYRDKLGIYSRLCTTIALLAAQVLVTAGCGTQPVTIGHHEPKNFVDDSTLESWLGSTEAQIQEKLGAPHWGLQDGETRYYVYRGLGQSAGMDVHFLIFPPMVVPLPQFDSELSKLERWCLKLTFNPTLSDFEKRLKRKSATDCRTTFPWPRSVDSMEAAWREARAEELRVKAGQGNADAAMTLARDYGELEALSAIVAQAEPAKAYDWYALVNRPLYKTPQAIVWLCNAASGDHSKAQSELAFWHRPDVVKHLKPQARASLQSSGVLPDARVAYMWYTLADRNGDDDAISYWNAAAIHMTPEEIAQAEQMARDWKPGDCPSAEHRLGVPESGAE